MKKAIQILILTWFVIASTFVLIGGVHLVWSSFQSKPLNLPDPPKAPECPVNCGNPKSLEDATKLYTLQTDAYTKQLAAIRAKGDADRSPAQETFKAVAKDIFQPLLTTILTALLAYVFAQGAGTLINNHLLLRQGKEPESFKL
jgi:hypothetical protein